MALTKEQKQKAVKELKENIAKQKSIVFVDFTGLGVSKMTELRKKMKADNCQFKVAKKTLIKITLKDINKEISEKIKTLKGEIALGFGYEDEAAPFKILGEFSKENKSVKILGGLIESQKGEFLGMEQAVILSKLPSRQELLAKIAGSMNAPISNFVNVLQGNIRNLVYVLSAIKK